MIEVVTGEWRVARCGSQCNFVLLQGLLCMKNQKV
jgi:hypothetical protein